MINYKKIITLSLLTLAPLVSMADSGKVVPGIDGSFTGSFKGQKSGPAHLIAQPVNGCDGCFIATIFKYNGDIQAKVYKALPLNTEWSAEGNATSSEYSLTPLGVDPQDGEITTVSEANVHDDNPSMRLSIRYDAGGDDVEFSIVASGSQNMDAFASAMNFNGKRSRFGADDGDSGMLANDWRCKSVGTIGQFTVSDEDKVTRFARISSFGDRQTKSGVFQLEEKAPGLFTYTSVQLEAYGEELANLPAKMVVFVNKGRKERAFLIDPTNSTNVDELRVR